MSTYEVLPITEKDVDYASRVMRARWGVSAEEAGSEMQRYLACDENAAAFCVHKGGEPVGVGFFDRTNDEISKEYSPWLLLLWVEPEHRGNGLGIRLTKARMDHARKWGYTEVFIDATDALGYHLRFDWEKIAPMSYQGKPGWILRFDLSKPFQN